MALQEHVHIISAGENIHKTYPVAIRDLSDITHTFVFADIELYTNSPGDDERVKAEKTAAREAVTEVKSISASLKIPCPLVYVTPPAFASARDAVLKIRKDHPDARYSFDLSAGSKDLSMALFAISLWLEGDAYYAFGERKGEGMTTKLAVPKTPAREVIANPNYLRILSVLYRTPGKQELSPRMLPRSYIFNQFESFYVPVRTKGGKGANTISNKTSETTGKKAQQPRLSQGTFTSILATLAGWDLIREEPGPGNSKREKSYRITPAGELALQLAEART